jgi:hypothetical protein
MYSSGVIRMSRESAWVEEFLNCQFPLLKDEISLDEAKEIMLNHKPEKLYKYREANDFGFSVIETEKLWLARANTVNDVRDCCYIFYQKDILDYYEHNLKTINPGISDETIRQSRLRDIERNISDQRDGLRESIKLCSLSQQFDILEMWERYSEDHTGFCVEFDTQKTSHDIWEYLFPVLYSNTKVDFTPYFIKIPEERHKLNPSFIRRALLTKSLDWEYEKEWRIIYPAEPEKLGVYCSGMPISCVYLGYMASQKTSVHIESICTPKGIPVKKMRKKGKMLVIVA